MHRRYILLLFVLSGASGVQAQGTLFDVLDPTKTNNTALLSKNGKPVEGNPNLFENFLNGTIYSGKNETFTNSLVNIDLYNKKLLINVENVAYNVNPANIRSVKIHVRYDSTAEFKYVNSNLAQVLYEDSTHAVYVNYSVKIRKGSTGNGYQEAKNDSFELSQVYELTKPVALTFTDSKDLLKKISKMEGPQKEKINSLGKLKGEDMSRIIHIVKNL